MNFIFVCSIKNEVFESADFRIMENRGVYRRRGWEKDAECEGGARKPLPALQAANMSTMSVSSFVRSPAWMALKRIRLMELNKKVKLTATVTGSG